MVYRHFTSTSLLSFTQKRTQHNFFAMWLPNCFLSMQILKIFFHCFFLMFKRLNYFQFSQENVALIWEKKPNRCMVNQKTKTCLATWNASIYEKELQMIQNFLQSSYKHMQIFPFFNHIKVPPLAQGKGKG
jgi:hypothetical protein